MSPSMCLEKQPRADGEHPNSGYGSGRDLGLAGVQAGHGESPDLSTEGPESPQSSCCSFSTNLTRAQHVMSCCTSKHELKSPENPNSANEKWRTKHPSPGRRGIAYPGEKIQGASISL